MEILNSIVLKISSAFTALLVIVGLASAPVVIPAYPIPTPIEIAEEEVVDPAPVVVKEKITPAKIVVQESAPLQANNTALEVVAVPEIPTLIIQIEEKKPEKKDDIFKEQEFPAMGKIEKTFSITPQKGSPLKARTDITLEQLREYVIQTNYQLVAFRNKMENASEEELIDYLKANGFTVKID